jgi:dihydroneopterin aldolase
MESMMKVFLRDLRFNAGRGVYKEEHLTGTEMSVDIEVIFLPGESMENEQQTISYVDLFEIVKGEISLNGALLESVAIDIANKVKSDYPFVTEINITISKMQPPILNFQGRAGIHYHKVF